MTEEQRPTPIRPLPVYSPPPPPPYVTPAPLSREDRSIMNTLIEQRDRAQEKIAVLTLQIEELREHRSSLTERLTESTRLVDAIPKKILAAVNAEQLRCGKISEAFWNEDDKLNADLRVKLTQAEKSMAYMISTHIRAMRWREENFTEKRNHGRAICGWCAGTGKEERSGAMCPKCAGTGGKRSEASGGGKSQPPSRRSSHSQ